jgi:esterase/lipase superfamily enzyme
MCAAPAPIGRAPWPPSPERAIPESGLPGGTGGFKTSFVKVFFATNRTVAASTPRLVFGNGRRQSGLDYGTVYVDVPIRRSVGSLQGVEVLRAAILEKEQYFTLVRDEVAASSERQALVFVHGFNVSFDDAARRTAQIKVDTHFNGPAMFFSWPSQASNDAYLADLELVTLSLPLLKQYLLDVAERLDATRIHVIAHSMGTHALSEAVSALSREGKVTKPIFDQVVLAAADIDTEGFVEQILPHFVKSSRRLTMYATPADLALTLSSVIRKGRPRIGQDIETVIHLPGIEGLDASCADCVNWWAPWRGWHHSYVGDVPTVLKDIESVLAGQTRDQRVSSRYLNRSTDRFLIPNP